MNPEEYIKWLDEQIAQCKLFVENKSFGDDVRTWQYGKLNGLREAKNKFAIFWATNSVLNPPNA